MGIPHFFSRLQAYGVSQEFGCQGNNGCKVRYSYFEVLFRPDLEIKSSFASHLGNLAARKLPNSVNPLRVDFQLLRSRLSL